MEEHFYLLLIGLATLFVAKRWRMEWRSFLLLCVALFLLFLFLRVAAIHARPFAVRTHMIATHFRLDTLIAGILLSVWHRYRPHSFLRAFGGPAWPLLLLIVLLLAPVMLSDFGSFTMATYGITAVYLASAVAVGMAVARRADPVPKYADAFLLRPLAWVGRASYTTYLWHMAVFAVLQLLFARAGMQGSVAELLVFLPASVLVGWLTAVLLERPILLWRDKHYP